ncbi:hypothetical protein MNL01_00205 [Bartonella krasnovii]|uniref:hypothetical protein n=1 Tax=Bartonella krasnovii TaxID=2267275 RepID=UPI001F4CF757|nr:hypothetical protein [Bartonella krasnovii]UNF53817.1 hypothetical protein MNL01_00205 [Bartonella krasnovii]
MDSTGKITDSSFNDVGSAFAGLDINIKNVNQRIKEVSEGVAQDSLSWSKEANAFSAQHGKKKKQIAKLNSLLPEILQKTRLMQSMVHNFIR